MFAKIFAIAWKDAILRFSSWTELLFFIILPLTFTFLLGGSSVGAPEGVRLLVSDADGSALSAELITQLDALDALRVDELSATDAATQFGDEQAVAWLALEDGFEDVLLRGDSAEINLSIQPDTTDAVAVQQAIGVAVGKVSRAISIANRATALAAEQRPFESDAERNSFFDASLAAAESAIATAPEKISRVQPEGSEGEDGFNLAAHQSAGQLITWVFIPLLATSGMFAYERTYGTFRRLLTTPTKSTTYLLGTIFGQLGLGLVQMLLLVGFGALVMGVKWGSAPVGLALMLFTFGLASVALGTLMGTFVKTESQAGNISIMAGMVMALIGGCWYPIELFPESARTVSRFFPTHWAMQGLTDLSMRGLGTSAILPEAGILVAFAAVFFAVAVLRFRAD